MSARSPESQPLRETADSLAELIARNGGPAEYGEALVAYVDAFVEETRPVPPELLDHYTAIVGAVLGESIIAAHGGEWSSSAGAWGVRFASGRAVYPFQAARRHLEQGAGESVLAAFHRAGQAAAEAAEPAPPPPGPDSAPADRLRHAAGLFVSLARDAGRDLKLDEQGVRWADDYVEAVRPVESAEQLRVHSALVGAFLGECMIAAYGGQWSDEDGEWAVDFGGGDLAYPFRKTMAHLQNGSADSILALYRSRSLEQP